MIVRRLFFYFLLVLMCLFLGISCSSSKRAGTPEDKEDIDQGFNEKGEQVWGTVKGGYEFVKQ